MDEVEAIARTVYGEAGSQTLHGKLAMAWLIINRHEAEQWYSGKTYWETVLRPDVFQCWNWDSPIRSECMDVGLGNRVYAESYFVSLGALLRDSRFQDPVAGSTHYHHSSLYPPWVGDMQPQCIIGEHVFYRRLG